MHEINYETLKKENPILIDTDHKFKKLEPLTNDELKRIAGFRNHHSSLTHHYPNHYTTGSHTSGLQSHLADKALIIGAGLAGLAAVHALRNKLKGKKTKTINESREYIIEEAKEIIKNFSFNAILNNTSSMIGAESEPVE